MSNLLQRVVNAARTVAGSRAKPEAPRRGLVVSPPPWMLDDLLLGELTPARVGTILRAAVDGDPSEQHTLFDQMLETDLRLRSVWNTRRRGLTGLRWELIAASEVGQHSQNNPPDEELAAGLLDDCLEVMAGIEGLDESLAHLAQAIGYGTAAVELEWDTRAGQRVPVAAHVVPFALLQTDRQDRRRLRIQTQGDWTGIAPDEYPAGKFIVHTPETLGGARFRGGLLRASTFNYLTKRYGVKWWTMALERFGMPLTMAKYPDNASEQTRLEMLRMIRSVGVAWGGVFPQGCEVEFVEGKAALPGGGFPHQKLIEYVDAEYAVEFLGATLTVQMDAAGGSRAAAEVHDQVRADLRDADIEAEAATIRRDLLTPIVAQRFGPEAARMTPYFRRVVEKPKDLTVVGANLALAVNQLGLSVPISYAVSELGVPVTDGVNEDDPIPGQPQQPGFGDPFGLGGGASKPATDGRGPDNPADAVANKRLARACGDSRVLANRLLTTIARRRSPLASIVPWMALAVTASFAHTNNVLAVIAAALASKSDVASATAALADSFASLPIDDLVELNRQALLATELYGRDLQRRRIAARRGVNAGRGRGAVIVNAASINFARLPFDEAIAALRERIGIDPQQFENLDRAARSRAFRVAGVWNMELLSAVHDELVSAVASGATMRDFRRSLPEMADRRGWTGESPWHADLVFFQNSAMAYAAGAHRQNVEAGVPAWRFVANGESCPICAPEVGKVYSINDVDRVPPLHFNCDCDQEPVFEEELGPSTGSGAVALNRSADEPNPALESSRSPEGNPDAGFKFDVRQYAALPPLDLSRFPIELRAAFRALAAQQGWEVVG